MESEILNQIYGKTPEPLKLRNDFDVVKSLFIEFDNNDIYHKSRKVYHVRLIDFCKTKSLDDSLILDLLDFSLYV